MESVYLHSKECDWAGWGAEGAAWGAGSGLFFTWVVVTRRLLYNSFSIFVYILDTFLYIIFHKNNDLSQVLKTKYSCLLNWRCYYSTWAPEGALATAVAKRRFLATEKNIEEERVVNWSILAAALPRSACPRFWIPGVSPLGTLTFPDGLFS